MTPSLFYDWLMCVCGTMASDVPYLSFLFYTQPPYLISLLAAIEWHRTLGLGPEVIEPLNTSLNCSNSFHIKLEKFMQLWNAMTKCGRLLYAESLIYFFIICIYSSIWQQRREECRIKFVRCMSHPKFGNLLSPCLPILRWNIVSTSWNCVEHEPDTH